MRKSVSLFSLQLFRLWLCNSLVHFPDFMLGNTSLHTHQKFEAVMASYITHKFTRTAVSMSSSTCYKHAQITKPAPMLKFHSNSLCTKVVYASKLYLLRT